MPAIIEKLEMEQEALTAKMSEPDFYQQDPKKVSQVQQALSELEAKMAEAFERWELLEEKANS